MEKRRALLLGGTGAMGVYLAPILAVSGYAVDVTTRAKPSDEVPGVRFLIGNALDDHFLCSLLKAHHYDAIIDFMIYRTAQFSQRLERLLRGTGQYFFVSTYRVFADAPVITESSPRLLDVTLDRRYLRTDEYALAKARQEDALRASGAKNWTIIRPGITYSTGRLQLGTLEADMVLWRAQRDAPVALPTQMLGKETTLTWAGDVAQLIAKLVGNPEAQAQDFNIVTAEHHPWQFVADIYLEVAGTKVQLVDTDAYIKAMGGGQHRYQVNYDRMYNRVLDNRKILSVTGFRQEDFTKLQVGLTTEISRSLCKTSDIRVDIGRQARFDRLTKSFVGLQGLTRPQKISYIVYRIPFVTVFVPPAKLLRRAFKFALRPYTNYGKCRVRY